MNAEQQVPSWMPDFVRLEPQLLRALPSAEGTHDLEDVLEGVATGRLHFWPGRESVVVTEFIDYPRLRAINFFLAAGDLDELGDMEETIVKWAQTKGCTRAMGMGRRGFQRTFFRDRGYTPKWYVMYREI